MMQTKTMPIFPMIFATLSLWAKAQVDITCSPVQGIGAEAGVMRRDPSDIIRVGVQFYVWYSKGKVADGYDATVWYATSPDGKKKALAALH